MIKHFLNPPNWFTSASLFCSTYALTLMLAEGEPTPEVFTRACILIIFGGVFDMLDGRVARLTNRYTEFGVQLDSFADLVGFGIAPAMVAWKWRLHELGTIGILVAFWYVLTAAYRLARFNVAKADEGSWDFPGHSQGLTTTMAGGCLVSLIWVFNGYLSAYAVEAGAIAWLTGILGFLMISSVPMRNFRDMRRNRWARRLLGTALGACLVGALFLDPSMWWGIGAALYLGVGVFDGMVVAILHRRLRRALMLEEMEEVIDGTAFEDDDLLEAMEDAASEDIHSYPD